MSCNIFRLCSRRRDYETLTLLGFKKSQTIRRWQIRNFKSISQFPEYSLLRNNRYFRCKFKELRREAPLKVMRACIMRDMYLKLN